MQSKNKRIIVALWTVDLPMRDLLELTANKDKRLKFNQRQHRSAGENPRRAGVPDGVKLSPNCPQTVPISSDLNTSKPV